MYIDHALFFFLIHEIIIIMTIIATEYSALYNTIFFIGR